MGRRDDSDMSDDDREDREAGRSRRDERDSPRRDKRDSGRRRRYDREDSRERDSERDRDRDYNRDRDRGRYRSRDDRGSDRSRRDRREREDDREHRDRDSDREAARPSIKSRLSGREGEENKEGDSNKDSKKEEQDSEKKVAKKKIGGGVYIPPFKMAQLLKEVEDKSGPEYQRMTWDALRKSINGLINKVNTSNITNILPEIFSENLVRGRGLFARSVMKSQMASPPYTPVYAALVSVVNTKFPEIGELILKRVILQFRRAFKRNDKPICIAATKFLGHLVMQQVGHEVLVLELLTLLLSNPTDDSVEVSIELTKECGYYMNDVTPQGVHSIFERFRSILHEGDLDKRTQFMIENLFALRKSNFEGKLGVPADLDLVEAEDQITHEISLDDQITAEPGLDLFKVDPDYVKHEEAYQDLKKELMGEDEEADADDEDDSDDDDDDDDDDDEEDDEDDDEEAPPPRQPGEKMTITDMSETDKVNLRRTIYLTIMSSLDFEEAGHKLLKLDIPSGAEVELVTMLIECCSQEKTYLRYYGLLSQRFCFYNQAYQAEFEIAFDKQFQMIHRLETNKLRNVAKIFAHLLGHDAVPWSLLSYITLTQDDTTSSSRIFIKILFQELAEHLGLRTLNERLSDPSMQEEFKGVFPKDIPKNTRFAINFFTSIGLGGLTDSLREHLKNMPKMIMEQQKQVSDSDSSDSDSDSSSDSSTDSSSDSSDSDSSSSSSGSSSSSSSSGSGSSSSSSSSSSGSEDERPIKKKRKKAQ